MRTGGKTGSQGLGLVLFVPRKQAGTREGPLAGNAVLGKKTNTGFAESPGEWSYVHGSVTLLLEYSPRESLHGPTKGSAQEHSIYPSIIPGMGGGGILRAHPGRMSSQKPTMEY